MNNKNCKDILDEIRSNLDETGITSGKWSDTEIVRVINNVKNHYVNLINTINSTINGRSSTITYVSGTELYDLPGDLDSITRVELVSNSEKVEQIDIDEKEQVRSDSTVIDSIVDSSPSYYIWGSQIGLVNITGNVKIYYIKRIPDLHYGTAVTGGSTTTLIFDATPNGSSSGDYTVKRIDDYYIGAYIDMYYGTGSPQTVKITDYTGSTRTATFATASAHDTTTLYAIQYDLPSEIDLCIILQATILLCPKDGKSTADFKDTLAKQERMMIDGLSVSKERKHVKYVEC